MKKIVAILSVVLSGAFANAQCPPSANLELQNRTQCTMYFQVTEADASCNYYAQVVSVPATSVTTLTPTIPGSTWFEWVSVREIWPPSLSCFGKNIQAPWACCFSGLPNSASGAGCCHPTIYCSWTILPTSNSSTPKVVVYY